MTLQGDEAPGAHRADAGDERRERQTMGTSRAMMIDRRAARRTHFRSRCLRFKKRVSREKTCRPSLRPIE